MDISFVVWHPGGQNRYVDECWQDKEKPPLKTLRWWVLQALSSHTRSRQALRNQIRRSNSDNRAYRWIIFLKNPSRLTRGSGFIPLLIMSKECLLLWKPQKPWRLYDIDDVIDRMMEQFIGVLCYLCYDVISNAKMHDFSDSQWQGYIHRRSDKTRFQDYVDSNDNLLFVSAIPSRWGEDLLTLSCWIIVAIPLWCKEYLYHIFSVQSWIRLYKRDFL